jgi:hypothetical protein
VARYEAAKSKASGAHELDGLDAYRTAPKRD